MADYWFLDEQASALAYSYYAPTTTEKRVLVRVNVPCNYLRPLVLGAFAKHDRFWDVMTLPTDPRTPDLLVQQLFCAYIDIFNHTLVGRVRKP